MGFGKIPTTLFGYPTTPPIFSSAYALLLAAAPVATAGRNRRNMYLSNIFFGSTVAINVRTFARSCLHCLSTTGGERVPRPFCLAFHGTAANDLLQFDNIEIAPNTSGQKHAIMLRDDHPDYKWFFACHNLTAETAARATIDWCAACGVPKSLMSDGPTHFKNETLRLLSKGLKVRHHFTLPYFP